MAGNNELKYYELNNRCDFEGFNFDSTDELEPINGIIGQERARKAMDIGLKIKADGYNIYMCGPSGLGKTTYAKMCAMEAAKNEPKAWDYCYVYNFDEPKRPLSLKFEAGRGKEFRDDMNELVEFFDSELVKVFSSADYEEQKSDILKKFDEKRNALVKEISDIAAKHGFAVKSSNGGMFFMPMLEGEELSEEKYEALSNEKKDEINSQSGELTSMAASVLREIQECDGECKKAIGDLDYKTGMFSVSYNINVLQEKYSDNEKAIKYIADVQEDLLDNISKFTPPQGDEEEQAALIPVLGRKTPEDILLRYKVNLVVDNSKTQGAPVVVDYNPTVANLCGEMEYDNEFGNFTTDFMKIKPGLFHKANGGYLILQARDIVSSYQAWDAIRRIMRTGEIKIDGFRDQLGTVPVQTLEPEPIEVKIKIILVGSNFYYDLLCEYEEDFEKYFKILADFDYEMERNDENIYGTARFIKMYSKQHNLMPFKADAVAGVIEYSSRMAERKNKLTTRFNKIGEILCEADAWAKIDGADIITRRHIKKAIYEKKQRLMLYEEKLAEMVDNGSVMIDTTGKRIGQINGLSVIDVEGYAFGNVSRITAVSYMGKSGIINIEKEAEMSGNTHTKGMNIIAGYIGGKYAQQFPLSLSCRVCFEQNYGGIDGDSASSTELYCIISSLSEIPISQEMAVTGSVNQFGDIQAIGGVNEKIEAFFNLCSKRGLMGNQGVLIPKTNVGDLMLNDDVVNAVKDGKFHIYAISSIDEGIELLMGTEAGKPDKEGNYPENSVHGKVMAKLNNYYVKSFDEPEDE